MNNYKITALYARLSSDDMQEGDSNSIIHQKAILQEYAINNGFSNRQFYVDDGWSGTSFNRPDFKRMLADVESGIIDTIIVKDLSRFGRENNMAGMYIETILPQKDVRFISISENVDTLKRTGLDIMPLHNFMNTMYAKDISCKQRAVIQHKGNNGQRLTSRAIYGYIKDENKNWQIDEFAADIVRQIYSMYISGMGVQAIAKSLTNMKIPTPSVHNNSVKSGTAQADDPYKWSVQTISAILSKQEYCGDTVNFRTEKPSFKSKKIIRRNKNDLKIFKDTHPAIIERDVFEKAAQLMERKTRRVNRSEPALFSAHLFCADCKSKMHIVRGGSQNDNRPNAYTCCGYRKKLNQCTSHYIREDILSDIVLKKIQSVIAANKLNGTEFRKGIEKSLKTRNNTNQKLLEKQLEETKNRIDEIENAVKKMYEEKLSGTLDNETFALLSEGYVKEKKSLENTVTNMLRKLSEENRISHDVSVFFNVLNKYAEVTELTQEVVANLIDRIEVHESTPVVGKRIKNNRVDIYFIGAGIIEI